MYDTLKETQISSLVTTRRKRTITSAMGFLPRHSRLLLLLVVEETGENEVIRARKKTENLIFLSVSLSLSFSPSVRSLSIGIIENKQRKLSRFIHKQPNNDENISAHA